MGAGEPSRPICIVMEGWVGRHGMAASRKKEYPDLPDFLDLREQAEELLVDANDRVQDFSLWFDEAKLGNANTLPLLRENWANVRGRMRIVVKRDSPTATNSSLSSACAGSSDRAAHAGAPAGHTLRGPAPLALARTPAQRRAGFLVCLDGNIGSGKTTLMDYLAEIQCGGQMDVKLVREPIKAWWKLLDELYKALKQSDASLRQQAVADLEDAIWEHHAHIACMRQSEHVITERGLQSQIEVFCYVLSQDGLLSQEKYVQLCERYRTLMSNKANHPTATIYCYLSFRDAKERVELRAQREQRHFEKDMPLEYLQKLEERYESIYRHGSDHAPVVVVDANHPKEDLANHVASGLHSALRRAADKDVDDFMDVFKDRRSELASGGVPP